MKSCVLSRFGLVALLAFFPLPWLAGQEVAGDWFSPAGTPVASGNPVGEDGLIREVRGPVLHVSRSTAAEVRGTALLLPGGGYFLLSAIDEGSRTAAALNRFGYDVVTLEYHVHAGEETRALALADALAAWRLVRQQPETLGVHSGQGVVMGYSAGAHLATRLEAALAAEPALEPDDLVLVYPAYLDETAAGATTPQVRPPARPKSRLVVMMAADDKPEWLRGAHAYADAWTRGGGSAIFQEFTEGGHGFGMKPDLTGDLARWPEILAYFLENGPKPGVGPFNTYLPWFLGSWNGRLAEFRATKAADHGAVVFLGDSITRKWDLPAAFPELQVANRGISGDTTRGMLVRLADNVLDLEPRAIVFLGGINDLSEPQQPRGTPETIAANVRSILERIRAVCPDTPVLLCETLPSAHVAAETVVAANAAVDRVAADFPNVHRVRTHDAFLRPDGAIDSALFLDGTHPNADGYAVWKRLLDEALARYMPAGR